jgi:hypothetical protein
VPLDDLTTIVGLQDPNDFLTIVQDPNVSYILYVDYENMDLTFGVGPANTDFVTVTETYFFASFVYFVPDQFDTVTVTDQLFASITILRSYADSVTMSDLVNFNWPLTLVGDSVIMADAALRLLDKGVNDAVTMSDDAPVFGLTRTFTDSVTMSDAYGPTFAPAAFNDSVTMSDSVAKTPSPVFNDSVTMSDSQTYNWPLRVDDSVTMSDTQTYGWPLTLADSVTMSEALAKTMVPATYADSVTMSDSPPTFAFLYDRTFNDSVTMSDDASGIRLLDNLLYSAGDDLLFSDGDTLFLGP